MMERFAVHESLAGPFQPRRLSAFVSAIGGLAADRLVVGGVVDDPNVWSGRASQEVFVELVVSGLASMYPAFGGVCLLGPS